MCFVVHTTFTGPNCYQNHLEEQKNSQLSNISFSIDLLIMHCVYHNLLLKIMHRSSTFKKSFTMMSFSSNELVLLEVLPYVLPCWYIKTKLLPLCLRAGEDVMKFVRWCCLLSLSINKSHFNFGYDGCAD